MSAHLRTSKVLESRCPSYTDSIEYLLDYVHCLVFIYLIMTLPHLWARNNVHNNMTCCSFS